MWKVERCVSRGRCGSTLNGKFRDTSVLFKGFLLDFDRKIFSSRSLFQPVEQLVVFFLNISDVNARTRFLVLKHLLSPHTVSLLCHV